MRKTTNKVFSVLMAIVLVLSAAPLSGFAGLDISGIFAFEAEAATDGTCGENLTWVLEDNGTLTVSGTGAMINYISESAVPWHSQRDAIVKVIIADGVTSVSDNAFYDCTQLISVSLPNTLTSIGGWAFRGCNSLTSIVIPDSVTSIGSMAFFMCYSLANVTLSKGITTILSSTFASCENLVSIVIPDGVTEIGVSAFSSCTKLQNVTIPNSVKIIGDSAFYYCNSLKSVLIPENVNGIGANAFGYCQALESITVDPDNKYYFSDEYGVVFNKDKTVLVIYPSNCKQTSYTIPATVTSFGRAFNGSNIKELTIADGVTKIEENALYNCGNIKTVRIGSGVTEIAADAFPRVYSDAPFESVFVDEENEYYSSDEYGVLFNKEKTELLLYPVNCKKSDYVIPEGVVSFGHAFSSNDVLTSIHIPSTVTSLWGSSAGTSGAFSHCLNLTTVTFADNSRLTSIGNNAFYRCDRLASVTIPDSVTIIGESAFESSGLSSINISPNSKLQTIGESAFSYCHGNFEIFIPAGVKSISEKAFRYSDVLEFVVDENNSYYSSDNGVLFNKDKTKLLCYPDKSSTVVYVVPSTVTEISSCAFVYSENLIAVVLPDGIKTIASGAFEDCRKLSNINFPGSLETIGNSAFHECNSLAGVGGILVLGDGLVAIGEQAFSETGITQVHVPSSVLAMGGQIIGDYWGDENEKFIICSDSNTAYAKTYAINCGYTFKLCDGNHTPHTCSYVSEVTKAATCTKSGIETFTCECGDSYTQTIPATGHSYGEWVETVKPTTASNGKKVRTCGNCGATQEQTVPKLPEVHTHSYTATVTKAATCTQTGIKTFTCSCGNSYTQTIPSKGHSYGEWIVVVEPTLDSTGKKVRHCTSCGNEQTQVIDRVTNDDEIVIITPPSTTVINYGDTLILYADVNIFVLPAGCTIVWTAIGNGVVLTPSEDGLSCKVTSVQNGNVTVIATVVDENGNAVTDMNGSEISFSQQLNSKVNFWQKLISFFKNLFGISRIILQSI